MAKLRTSLTQAPKQKLSQTLRSWLPILQSNLESLMETLEPFKEDNPFLDIRAGNENQEKFFKKKANFFDQVHKNSVSDTIEALTLEKPSLYDTLFEQINPPLFPTKKSQTIANKIIEYINHEGYFEYEESILKELGCHIEELERVRKRFAHLEPLGVGSKNFKECFLFQLEHASCKTECYELIGQLIEDFDNLESYAKKPYFKEAMAIIKTFRAPPALDFMEEESPIVPDIFIFKNHENIEVTLNDAYYPKIHIETKGLDEKERFISQKIREGKDLIDALEMRKATLYKIGLMIVEHQYDFFVGGDIKPMKLKDLAQELDRNPSTISRAISNKYISCDRGVIPLKQFFTTAIDDETSNSTIKEFISQNISYENRQKPLSDIKILKMVENQFNITLSRRTITKYRKQLNIAGSSERKKLYILQG